MLCFTRTGVILLTERHFRDFLLSSHVLKWNGKPLPGSYISTCFVPYYSRKIGIWHSLLSQNVDKIESFGESESNVSKKRKRAGGVKVCLIKENNQQTFMYLAEAEKYAQHKNLILTQLPNLSKKTPTYKLQKLSDDDEVVKRNVQNKETNKEESKNKTSEIILRQNISKHDIQNKIKIINKLLLKKVDIRVTIEGSNSELLDEIVNELEKSELQQYVPQKSTFKRGIRLFYQVKNLKPEEIKPKDKEKLEVQSEE